MEGIYDWAVLWEWVEIAARWTHVITAIAWIGSSFYFIALDLGLRKAPGMPEKAHGEEWQVHGGGFYHIQKYLVAPDRLPEHPHLVQMGKLRHMALGLRHAGAGSITSAPTST